MSYKLEASADEYIQALKKSSKFGPRVVGHSEKSKQAGHYRELPFFFERTFSAYLLSQGVDKLYTHQYQALELLHKRKSILLATPTASGKSLVAQAPICNALLRGDAATALFLYPLKALAQDQHRNFTEMLRTLFDHQLPAQQPQAAIFDGDTAAYARQKICRDKTAILFSNPEMLHLSLLAYHHKWAYFFRSLRYIVIDEVHSYRGVLGAHMAWVLRRLQRVAALYGAAPQVIMLSATIGNPENFARTLWGSPLQVVAGSGAPVASRHTLILDPEQSMATLVAQLFEAAVKRGLRTIVYSGSRKMTEYLTLLVQPRLGDLAAKVSSYRAGFLPHERRKIEKRLFSGELLGVISTSALELGIDVGSLDICILAGYPGSMLSTLQRIGRVGRAARSSASLLVAGEDALDQYFLANPEQFFSRRPESLALDPHNKVVARQHLSCAAAELPLSCGEELLATPFAAGLLEEMRQEAEILEDAAGGSYYSRRRYPHRGVSLRGGGEQLQIVAGDSGEIIGMVDRHRVKRDCYPGAIYLHNSVEWLVTDLHLKCCEVVVARVQSRYYTKALHSREAHIISSDEERSVRALSLGFGALQVAEDVHGYQQIAKVKGAVLASKSLELGKDFLQTKGVWCTLPAHFPEQLAAEGYDFLGSLHALEHLLIAHFPLFVLCDSADVGGIAYPWHEQTGLPTIFIYDGYSGGIGLALRAYELLEKIMDEAERTLRRCQCLDGCPSCVHSSRCGSGNRPIDKGGCSRLLQLIGAQSVFVQQKYVEPPRQLHALPSRKPCRYGVFDLESKRSAAEVGGWEHASAMGIALGVVYDSADKQYHTYHEAELGDMLAHLQNFDLLVGFNSKKFDNRLLEGYGYHRQWQIPHLDLLEKIYGVLGYRQSLAAIARASLGEDKSADGLQSLQWYRQGELDKIELYCRDDVRITHELYCFAQKNGYLLMPHRLGKVVRLPIDVSNVEP